MNYSFCNSDEIERYLRLFPKVLSKSNRDNPKLLQKTVAEIQEILQPRYRRYLKVFHLEDKASLTNTIFRAVFDSIDEEERRSSKSL